MKSFPIIGNRKRSKEYISFLWKISIISECPICSYLDKKWLNKH